MCFLRMNWFAILAMMVSAAIIGSSARAEEKGLTKDEALTVRLVGIGGLIGTAAIGELDRTYKANSLTVHHRWDRDHGALQYGKLGKSERMLRHQEMRRKVNRVVATRGAFQVMGLVGAGLLLNEGRKAIFDSGPTIAEPQHLVDFDDKRVVTGIVNLKREHIEAFVNAGSQHQEPSPSTTANAE